MKKLPVCDSLMDEKREFNAWQFCAPIYIASAFFGTFLNQESDLLFDEFTDRSVRSGTLTFIRYKGQLYAMTCKHVADALEEKQNAWKNEQESKYGFVPPLEGYYFFTPHQSTQYHFNYKLTPVPQNSDGAQPDVAIARINENAITRIGRKPIQFTDKKSLPETGIAFGYPEAQRDIRPADERTSNFYNNFVSCIATLQVTGSGDILLEDPIEHHRGVNNLSGMSGGPIVWSDEERYGLAGIVKKGTDIQPKPDGLTAENSICIFGTRMTSDLLDQWIKSIPPVAELKDHSKSLFNPLARKS